MGKSILIFGGGDNQLTLVRAAKELNIKSIVIDPNPNSPAKSEADVFEVVPPQDYELTKKIAQKYKVDGIVTGQMENPLLLMAKLAQELNFIFPSAETINKCRNKFLMKEAFLKAKIPCAKGILLPPRIEITESIIKDLEFPLIIKPLDAHSSRGVMKVDNIQEVIKNEETTRNFSSDDSLLIEEFIDGPEYSIEAITHKGKTTIIQYTEKLITPYPFAVEIGHFQPADLTKDEKKLINDIVIAAIEALGIDNSATHTELKITSDGPKIIEIGARLGGDYIASYLTLASTGMSMDKAAIQVALGMPPDLETAKPNFSMIKYFTLPVGSEVIKIEPWEYLLEEEVVIHAGLFIKEEERIGVISDSAKRSGFLILKSDNRESLYKEAVSLEEKFLSCITYEF